MRIHLDSGLLPATLLIVLLFPFPEARAQTVTERIAGHIPGFDYDLSFRYRYEFVEQDNNLDNANASTLRSRLTLRARPLAALGVLVEADNVSALIARDYDSFAQNSYRGSHSVVADPVGTDLNQALLDVSLTEGQSLVLGRQRIGHANQRFIGGVGWRQNEQTFDAASWQLRHAALSVDYSYIQDVNRVFKGRDPSAQIKTFDSESHVLLAAYQTGWGRFSAFAYALDLRNAAALSSRTLGISYQASLGAGTLNAAFARQADYAGNPQSYQADYYQADLSWPLGPVTVLAGYEVLGSDGGTAAFTTPLATLHAFQGWADMFLNTPAVGIKDAYLSVSGQTAGLALVATYHHYRSDEGGISLGDEWNLQASYPFSPQVNLAFKYARFDSESFAVDTDKFWLTLSVAF